MKAQTKRIMNDSTARRTLWLAKVKQVVRTAREHFPEKARFEDFTDRDIQELAEVLGK